MTMKELKTAQDVHEREEALKVQPELELLHTVEFAEGALPKDICVMYTHTKRVYWTQNSQYDEHEMYGFGGPSRYVQSTETSKWMELATFDEISLKRHIAKWGVKTWEKPSYCGGDMKEHFEQWLTYKKLPFKQLNGVKMYADGEESHAINVSY
jgi:hypothetical protein